MKKQVFYVHGGDSFSRYEDFLTHLRTAPLWDLPSKVVTGSWKQTLATDLGEEYEVFMPAMPNRQNAQYGEWKIWFERYLELLQGEVTLIGASLGGMFLAKYLSEETSPIGIFALYLLAAPGGEYIGELDNDCSSFKFAAADLAHLASQVPNIHIWHSEDDFVVPVTEALWYKKHLPQAELRLFKDKNHFLVPELPELLASLRG